MTESSSPVEHPSPHRSKVSVPWLLAGLMIPPAVWALEMLVGFAVSSNACPLPPERLAQAGFAGEAVLLVALQIVCLITAIASGVMSWRQWNRVRHEKEDSDHAHLTLGEGRTRFVALGGMLTAGAFMIAILFNLLEPILIPLCWSLR